VRENGKVVDQLANNSDEQALLGDFPNAVEDAIIESGEAFQNQKLQLLADPKKAAAFAKLVFDLIKMAG
jgi:type I restriction enzyme R subunit